VLLVASAPPGTDIFVIDSQFRIVARGARRLEKPLSPGIYKVKFQAGLAVHETPVVLKPGAGSFEVSSGPLAFQSSAPLARTGATHEYHMANAKMLSDEVHVADAPGAQIFVFARAWTDPNKLDRKARFPRGQHPAKGLTLHDVNGRLVSDFEQAGHADLNALDPWSGCTIELAPGPYRLRLKVPDVGAIEQIIVAPPGWQAQVFLLQDNNGTTESPFYGADLAGGSILLARAQDGFDPGNDSLRLTELARTALTRRRVVVAHDLLKELLGTKFENPMLGLYAAHTLLAAPEPDRHLLQSVVQNLRGMLGPHPDVEALALYLGETVTCAYDVPPMLRRSWSIVVERAARRRDLVPSGSLASHAGNAIWGNSAWFIWESEAAQEPAEESSGFEEAVRRIEDVAVRLVSPEGQVAVNANLDDVEQAMLSYVTRRAKYRKGRSSQPREFALDQTTPVGADIVGEALGVPAPALSILDPSEIASLMAEELKLPASTIEGKMGRLLRKLDQS